MNTSTRNDPDTENQQERDQVEAKAEAVDQAEIVEDTDLTSEDVASQSADLIRIVQRQLDEQKNLYLRSLAEMENLKKRHSAELVKARKFAIDQFAKEMVNVIESLDKACEIEQHNSAETSVDAMREGVEMIRKQMLNAFEKFSIAEINPKPGDPFNSDEQQAISIQPRSDIPVNHVAVMFRKGYRIHNRLLRPAMVIVASEQETAKANCAGDATEEA